MRLIKTITTPHYCIIASLAIVLCMLCSSVVVAQPKRMTGLFVGCARLEQHLTLHGLVDTSRHRTGFSAGVVYEIPLSGHLALALMPQFSAVAHAGSPLGASREQDGTRQYVSLWMPPMYAFELPVSLRAGIQWKKLNPYISAGAFIGYTIRDAASISMSYDSPLPERELPVLGFEPFSRFTAGIQCGAGIRFDIFRSVALWTDFTLMKHLNDPVDTDLLSFEAPLRGLWHFGVLFALDGGDK